MAAWRITAWTLIGVALAAAPAEPFFPTEMKRLFPNENAWAKSCGAVRELYGPGELTAYRIYIYPRAVDAGHVSRDVRGNLYAGPDAASWLFFVDEAPPANWGHPCRLVFVTTKTYDVWPQVCSFPPADVEDFIEITETVLDFLDGGYGPGNGEGGDG
jgi:hypothetical protein